MSVRHTSEDATEAIASWRSDLARLYDEVARWSDAQGWQITRGRKTLSEDVPAVSYEADVLEVATPEGRLYFEPVARLVYRARGRVDLHAYPTLSRVMLLGDEADEAGGWIIRTDSGIDWPNPWSQATFYQLAKGLLRYP